MSQVGSVYQVETTIQTHTGDLTYTTKMTVLGSAFDASSEYLMIVRAQVGGSITTRRFKFRTQIGGATPEGAEMIMEPDSSNAGDYHVYAFLHKFTTAVTPEDITFQIAPQENTGTTARADTIIVLAFKLDDLAATDWFYGEDTTDNDHTTEATWGDEASITFTPANTNDDWLVITWGSVRINHLTKNWRYRISESVSAEVEPLMSQEGEDTLEELPWMLMRPYTLTAAEHVIKVQSNDDSASGVENQHNISKIFALRLNAFEQHTISWAGGTFDTPDTAFNELAAVSFTPDTTGNGVVMGSTVLDPNGGFRQGSCRIQLAGTTIPTGSDANRDCANYDVTDFNCIPVLARFAVTGSSVADVDIDVKMNSANGNFVDSGFAAWSLELASAAPPAIQGDVTNIQTPGATLDYTLNVAITGDVTNTQTPEAGFTASLKHAITGTVTNTQVPGATLDYIFNTGLQGGVVNTQTPGATLDYTLIARITGDVTSTQTPGATLARNIHPGITGGVTSTQTPGATMLFSDIGQGEEDDFFQQAAQHALQE